MTGWLESVVGPDYAAALMWTIVGLIALLVLLILVRIVRGFGVGTFVAGGRNRKARLAVMDATAVDSHRRLVLVRRDDVEHLILIGGPTDVVVEQNIRLTASTRRQPVQDTIAEQPRPQPQQTQPPMQPAPRPAPPAPPAAPPRPAPVVPAPAAPATVPSGHMKPHAPQPQSSPQVAPVHVPPPAPQITPANQPAPAAPVTAKSEPDKTLDEEMSRLLNDLAGQR